MRAIVSLSGGMDSATLLASALADKQQVTAVGFAYGSKHNVHENSAARAIARHYGVPFWLLDLSAVMASFRSDLLLSGGTVPEGHYEAESMRRTVVPGRNTIFAAVLLGIAQGEGAGEVWLGVHAGDHHIYPDCRPAWCEAMDQTMQFASDYTVRLRTPFLRIDKGEILRYGLGLNVPYALTRTCYTADPVACGRCGACQERLAAFASLNVADPLEYQSREILPKA